MNRIAVLALVLVASCSTTPRRTEDERAADQSLADQVHNALLADADLYAAHINVEARAGVVWLTGWVTSATDSQLADRDSKAVPGVQRVVDQIEVVDWMPHW
jgi:osmotically-inducible protein OsmY